MSSGDGESLAVMVFLGFVAVSLLLCGLAAADLDDPEHFYAGGGAAFGPVGGGLAIAGDYISAATLLSTTGAVALDGADGILFACATVVSLYLMMRFLGEPLRRKGVFTLGDFVADRLGAPPCAGRSASPPSSSSPRCSWYSSPPPDASWRPCSGSRTARSPDAPSPEGP